MLLLTHAGMDTVLGGQRVASSPQTIALSVAVVSLLLLTFLVVWLRVAPALRQWQDQKAVEEPRDLPPHTRVDVYRAFLAQHKQPLVLHTLQQLALTTPVRSGWGGSPDAPLPALSREEVSALASRSPRLAAQAAGGRAAIAQLTTLPSVADEWCVGHWALPTIHLRWSQRLQPPGVTYARVHASPHILRVSGILTPEQAAHLRRLGDAVMERSRTVTAEPGETVQNPIRTSFSAMVDREPTPFLDSLLLRVSHVMGVLPQYVERMQVVRYTPGQYFKQHQDFLLSRPVVEDGGQRCKTLFVYLNDLPEGERGGRTQFTNLGGAVQTPPWFRHPEWKSRPNNTLDVAPAVGTGILWANMTPYGDVDFRTMHQGTTLEGSVKYGLNVWARTATQPHRVPQLRAMGWGAAFTP